MSTMMYCFCPTIISSSAVCADDPKASRLDCGDRDATASYIQNRQPSGCNPKLLHHFFMHKLCSMTLRCISRRQPSFDLYVQIVYTTLPVGHTLLDVLWRYFCLCDLFKYPRHQASAAELALRDRLSSTLRIFARLVQTPAQKIAASETMRTACSTGAAVRPKGPNGTHRSFHSDQ